MRWARGLARRLAFGLARLAKGRRSADGPAGRLLVPEQRNRAVVLIWALDQPPDAPAVVETLNRLAGVTTRVLVITSLDIRSAGQSGAMIEVIPDATIRSRHPGRDWHSYITRRMARIRESWDADLEVTVGPAPDDFLASLDRTAPVKTAPAPDPGVTDAPTG